MGLAQGQWLRAEVKISRNSKVDGGWFWKEALQYSSWHLLRSLG